MLSVLNVSFSVNDFRAAAKKAREVVDAPPTFDGAQPQGKGSQIHLPVLDAPQLCFTRDTLVSTESGLKQIGEISSGEKVWAFDFENGIPVLAEVETRHDNHYDGAVVRIEANGSWIETTAYHPFWVLDGRDLAERSVPRELDPREDEGKLLAGRWVNSHELRAGDTVYLQSGEVAKLTRIEQRYEPYLPVSRLSQKPQYF